ncbi:MAG: complex I NDUFA9 subunit family protein [Chloroflexi bacterium]|nr:complex I NDUFA9 subunit family protein [Chloroflexota bacterium]
MILLTGATGFVGRNVASALVERGHRLRCLVRQTANLSPLKGLDVEFAYGDVTDPASLAPATSGVDTVIHLVAIIREKGEYTFRRVNFLGTGNLVEAAKNSGIGAFLHISVIGASSDPRYPYLYSKWLGEQEVINSGIPYTVFRSSLIFGEGDIFFNQLAQIVRVYPVVPVVGPGKVRFQPVWVKDVARAFVQAVEGNAFRGRTLYLGGPEHISYEGIIDAIVDTLKLPRWKVHVPLGLVRPAVTAMEALLPNPPITTVELGMVSIDNVTEPDAVEKAFGFRPVGFREAAGYLVSRKGR